MTSKHSAYGRGARPLKCRECGALRSDGAQVSARGLCMECGTTRANEAARQMAAGAGPHYDEWARGLQHYIAKLTPSR